MSLRKSLLIACAVAATAALWLLARVSRTLRPLDPHVPVSISGAFPRNGQFPGEPLNAKGVRVWASWAGSDDRHGQLTIGPFPAPSHLLLAFGGYPAHKGIKIEARLATGDATLPLDSVNVGERWRVADFGLPPEWSGRPMTIVAQDDADGAGGWVGLSEPLEGGPAVGRNALYQAMAAWCINGWLLGIIYLAAWRLVAPRLPIPRYWIPLVIAGITALGGYVVFWTYFASPILGRAASTMLLAAAIAIVVFKRAQREQPTENEFRRTGAMVLVIGCFYVALVHLFPSALDPYDVTANRFREQLPGDNGLPYYFADRLFRGEPLRQPGADWLSSDRPPLEIGWELSTWWPLQALGLDAANASNTAGTWLQLTWVFAAYALLRTCGLPTERSVAWTLLFSITGFFVQNTIFIWPKLSSAAFGCAAFALWFLPSDKRRTRIRIALGAFLAALAWLSHGGIAFSFLPLVPYVIWRMFRGEAVSWGIAAGVFSIVVLPWFAYQKLYDPPGDRLLKWHFAGHIDKDPRGVLAVIREAYSRRTRSEILAAKASNFDLQVAGDWRGMFRFARADAAHRRDDEFFYPARALTWWLLGVAGMPIALWRARGARATHLLLLAWTLSTIFIWCLLMFGPSTAVIHQGSYAVMLVMFVLLSAWLEFAWRWSILIVLPLQILTFVTTWAGPNSQIRGEPTGWPFVTSAAVILAALYLRATFGKRDGEATR